MVDLRKSTCTGCKYYNVCGEENRKEPCAGKVEGTKVVPINKMRTA